MRKRIGVNRGEQEIMEVSVILTTYNGEKYLYKLLDSLKDQIYKLDEVLIFDDGSSDNTRRMLVNYIEKHHLDGWKTIFNSCNKGWKKNFRDGIQMAKYDLVFPCDQDDVWENDKIVRMVAIMEKNRNIQLLSSDYLPVYETGGQKVENVVTEGNGLEQVPFDTHFASGKRPGCVMCIRRTLIERVQDIWEDWYPYDAFLWTVSIFLNGCYIIHEPLIRYRRHPGNTTNHVTRDKEAVVLSLKRNKNLVSWLMKSEDIACSEKEKNMLKKFLIYADLRLGLLEEKKMINFFRLFNYRYFYRTFKQELGDLYLAIIK